MSYTSQLYMRKSSLSELPLLSARLGPLPEGVSFRTHIPGDDAAWEDLIERCFGTRYGFAEHVSACERYDPSHVIYLTKNGRDVAVSAAVQKPEFPHDGWLHFVGVDPEMRGLRLSSHVVLATLFSFYAQGYHSVVLSTDDFRIPAIKCYLKLGFEPIMLDKSHPERWKKVMEQVDGCV